MRADALAAFVQAIARSGLLAREQVGELQRLAANAADPQSVAREIVARGWLTAFQVKAFWKGEGPDLFVGKYVLLEKVGEGGMGDVYRARHLHMGRDVALKLIRREKLASPDAVRRFRQEMEAAAKLSHPNVVMTYDADADGERHYLAMEFVDGLTMTRLVRERGPLPVREACDYARQTALGLQHAHELGLIHRDIKPANLLVATRGNQVKILDMGLARFEAEPVDGDLSRITQEGLIIGTPDFIAPEQARNARKADSRADLYALGGTLFFLLTGEVPYPGGTSTEKLVRHATEPVPDPTRYRADLPPALCAIVARLMAKRPEDRFQTAAEVVVALESLSRGGSATLPSLVQALVTAAPDPSTETRFRLPPPSDLPRTKPRTNLTPAVLAGVGVGVLLIAGVVWMAMPPPTPIGREEATATRFDNDFRMTFARIEPGRFRMGSDDGEPSERPSREVEIPQMFFAGTTEVSQGQYAKLMGKNPSKAAPPRDAESWPVEMVSWEDAVAFCAKLNAADTRKQAGYLYRLPTETEWEYICRAGKATRFWCGDKLTPGRQAQFDPTGDAEFVEVAGTKPKGPMRVGRTLANEFGLHDTHGNVWEWCVDPSGDNKSKNAKMLRGGAWDTFAGKCRSAARWSQPADTKAANIGFRVVWAPG